MNTNLLKGFFDDKADKLDYWEKKNRYYYNDLEKIFSFLVPENSTVLEIGCGNGNLLAAVNPSSGLGIDTSPEVIKVARTLHPELEFQVGDVYTLNIEDKYDYIILSNLVAYLDDVQLAFKEIKAICSNNPRVIISYHNYLWEPFLNLAEMIGQRAPQPINLNWLSSDDIENLLKLTGFEVVKKGTRFLIPKYIPILSQLFNRIVDKLPFFRNLCLTQYIVARPVVDTRKWESKYSVSVIIPARNEKGNIEGAVVRLPKLGEKTEIIFVEGNSDDGTWEEIQRVYSKYKKIII